MNQAVTEPCPVASLYALLRNPVSFAHGKGATMPRYVIERTYDVDEDEMPSVGTRSKRIAIEHFPAIVWEHSHVVVDSDGTLKSFCVYDAPDEETVRQHAKMLGNHVVDHVYEIGGDVTPDDFPL